MSEPLPLSRPLFQKASCRHVFSSHPPPCSSVSRGGGCRGGRGAAPEAPETLVFAFAPKSFHFLLSLFHPVCAFLASGRSTLVAPRRLWGSRKAGLSSAPPNWHTRGAARSPFRSPAEEGRGTPRAVRLSPPPRLRHSDLQAGLRLPDARGLLLRGASYPHGSFRLARISEPSSPYSGFRRP